MPKVKAKPLPKKKVQKPVVKATHKVAAPKKPEKKTPWLRMKPKKKARPAMNLTPRDDEIEQPPPPDPPPPTPPDPEPEPEEPTDNPREVARQELNAEAEEQQAFEDQVHADQMAEAHRINTELNQNPEMSAPPEDPRGEVRTDFEAVAQENQDSNDQIHEVQIAEAQRAMEIFNPGYVDEQEPRAETREYLNTRAQENQDLNDQKHAEQQAIGANVRNATEQMIPNMALASMKPAEETPKPKRDVRAKTSEMEKRKKKQDERQAKKAGR